MEVSSAFERRRPRRTYRQSRLVGRLTSRRHAIGDLLCPALLRSLLEGQR